MLVLILAGAAGVRWNAALGAQANPERETWQRADDIVAALDLRPGDRVADVGAGDGFFTPRLSDRVGLHGRVLAVDVSRAQLDRLKANVDRRGLANVDLLEAAPADPRLPAGLAGILVVNAYHEFAEPQAMARAFRAALRPGGRVVIVEPFDSAMQGMPRAAQTAKHLIEARFVEADLVAAGFDVIRRDAPFARRSDGAEDWMLVAEVKPSAAPAALFEFRVGFWINLHHDLHARARQPAAPAVEWTDAVPEAARAGWALALTHYRTLGRRSLVFDDGMVRLSALLATQPDDQAPPTDAIHVETRAALLAARDAYSIELWPRRQEAAAAFTSRIAPMLVRHGANIASAVASVFGASWPVAPIPVELVDDAGPPGNAYTVTRPGRVTLAAAEKRHQGLAALEILFHEASHLWDATLQDGLREASRTEGLVVPPDLWHVVLFFTAGELTRRELARAGITYTPYAEAQGLATNAYRRVWAAVVSEWTPYLDRRRSMAASLTALVRAVGVLPPG